MERTEQEKKQLDRLVSAGIALDEAEVTKYLNGPDELENYPTDAELPNGYKRCGKCKKILKFYMFNVNNASKNKCTGNCKACQKASAAKSYSKTKGKRDYKKYYSENRERKQEHSRKYYAEHKADILEKQKEYHGTTSGRKVMRKAHTRRRKAIADNKGIPYKREYVVDRDKQGGEFPVCYLCGEFITVEANLQMDHVVPIALGGMDCFTNVACTHTLCNLRKEKDARKLTAQQVEGVIKLAEKYIDAHPELFAD